uniref:ARAD1B05918p n=1 Tax=Blastobotrys adeninivorans TaxID=409370 RepID=A0A060TB68_BLAAD
MIPPRLLRQINKLNAIACGPGAIRMPKEVSRLQVAFRNRSSNADKGTREFWKTFLPQVQFHNPNLPIAVTRYEQDAQSPSITVQFADGTEKKLDTKKKTATQVLKLLLSNSGATQVAEDELPKIEMPQY